MGQKIFKHFVFKHFVCLLCLVALCYTSFLSPVNSGVLGANVFFEQSKELLHELEHELAVNIQENPDVIKEDQQSDLQDEQTPIIVQPNNDQKLKLLNDLEGFINKLDFQTFTLRGISNFELEKLFYTINIEQDKSARNNEINLNEKSVTKLNAVFDLLRTGICYELSFDHLVIFRDSLICHLDEILTLVNYWTEQINNDTLFEKLQKVFVDEIDKKDLKLNVKKLSFLLDRIASYLGKVDELFLKFFKGTGSFENGLSNQPLVQQCEYFKTFVIEGTFCINSFFSEMDDPDKSKYNSNLAVFAKLPLTGVTKLLCKNHTGIQLLEDSFECQLDDYKIPNFFRRHWLLLSISGVAGVAAGVYLYKNREEIVGDAPTSLKNRLVNWTSETGEWVSESFVNLRKMVKEKFLPDTTGDRSKSGPGGAKTLIEDLQKSLNTLRENQSAWSVNFQKRYDELAAKGVFNGLAESRGEDYNRSMKQLFDALNKFQERDIRGKSLQFEQGASDLDQLRVQFRKCLNDLLGGLGISGRHNSAAAHAQDGGGAQAEQRGVSEASSSFARAQRGLFRRATDSVAGIGELRDFVDQAIPVVSQFLQRLDDVSNRNLDEQALTSLSDLISKFIQMINTLVPLVNNLGTYGQINETIMYRNIADILNLFYETFNSAIGKIDEGSQKVEEIAVTVGVILNWVKALVPVLLISVVFPYVGISIIRKIAKGRDRKKYDKINYMVSEIYRTLNYYNSASYDYYHRELRYKDQGLISFWLEKLNEKIEGISNGDKAKLLRLLSDLQNPNLSVAQKINFIKLEWGKSLFGNEIAA